MLQCGLLRFMFDAALLPLPRFPTAPGRDLPACADRNGMTITTITVTTRLVRPVVPA